MYKDKDKQREAVKLATQRYRAKGITKVSQEQGITEKVSPLKVTGMTITSEPTPLPVECGHLKVDLNATIYPPEPKKQSHNPMMVGYEPPT